MTRSVRSRRHRYAAAAGAVAALFAFTACSSSGSGSSGGGGPSGSTIKLGMISDVGTTVDYADAVAAAKAAVRGVNARGGIDGRKVELEFCNESLDPNKAAACARKLVSDKVMAFVGNQIVTYEQNADKLFAQAGIPNIGPVSYGPSGQDSNSYLLSPGQEYVNAAQAMAAVRYGGKKVALIRLDVPFTAPFESFYGKALAKLGGTKGVTAVIPATGQPDLAASASRLESSHPDVVNTNGNEIADTEILKSMAGLGYQGKMVVAADLFRYASLKQLGTLANRVIFASPYPPVSAAAQFPGLQQFEKDIATEITAGDKDAAAAHLTVYNRSYTLGAYFSVIAAAKIANQAKATTAAELSKAMKTAKNVDLGGVIPPWTPNKSISKTIPRASNGAFYISQWENGKVKLLTPKPIDVTGIVDASAS